VVRHLEAAAVDDTLDLLALLMATRLFSPARRVSPCIGWRCSAGDDARARVVPGRTAAPGWSSTTLTRSATRQPGLAARDWRKPSCPVRPAELLLEVHAWTGLRFVVPVRHTINAGRRRSTSATTRHHVG